MMENFDFFARLHELIDIYGDQEGFENLRVRCVLYNDSKYVPPSFQMDNNDYNITMEIIPNGHIEIPYEREIYKLGCSDCRKLYRDIRQVFEDPATVVMLIVRPDESVIIRMRDGLTFEFMVPMDNWPRVYDSLTDIISLANAWFKPGSLIGTTITCSVWRDNSEREDYDDEDYEPAEPYTQEQYEAKMKNMDEFLRKHWHEQHHCKGNCQCHKDLPKDDFAAQAMKKQPQESTSIMDSVYQEIDSHAKAAKTEIAPTLPDKKEESDKAMDSTMEDLKAKMKNMEETTEFDDVDE